MSQGEMFMDQNVCEQAIQLWYIIVNIFAVWTFYEWAVLMKSLHANISSVTMHTNLDSFHQNNRIYLQQSCKTGHHNKIMKIFSTFLIDLQNEI